MKKATRNILALIGLVGACLGIALPSNAQSIMPAVAEPAAVAAEPVVSLLPLVHSTVMAADLAGNVTTWTDTKLMPTGAAKALASFPFNGFKFGGVWVCQDDNIGGGSYYPTVQAGNFLEAGQSPIVLANDQTETTRNCVNYHESQIMHYSLFNADASCWKISGTWVTQNTWNVWTHVDLQINAGNSGCSNNEQHRANATSRGTAAVLGLIAYGPTGNGDNCIMNLWYQSVYYFAGTCETGRLGWLY